MVRSAYVQTTIFRSVVVTKCLFSEFLFCFVLFCFFLFFCFFFFFGIVRQNPNERVWSEVKLRFKNHESEWMRNSQRVTHLRWMGKFVSCVFHFGFLLSCILFGRSLQRKYLLFYWVLKEHEQISNKYGIVVRTNTSNKWMWNVVRTLMSRRNPMNVDSIIKWNGSPRWFQCAFVRNIGLAGPSGRCRCPIQPKSSLEILLIRIDHKKCWCLRVHTMR